MQEFQPLDQVRTVVGDASGVVYFASQIVTLLADRSARATAEPREALVGRLVAASLVGSKPAFAELLAELRRLRISVAQLADVYIPAAARQMGDAWLDDRMSWVDVTIGVGRLQVMLRDIGTAWSADQAGDTGHGAVLMIVPDREQHTLGPLVATGQMRRYGVSVCLRIAPSFDELHNLVTTRRFDGIMFSVATRETLTNVAKAIQFLRTASRTLPPVIIGGAVMSRVEDPAACTGADFSSNDIGAALEAMGLKFDAFCVLKRA